MASDRLYIPPSPPRLTQPPGFLRLARLMRRNPVETLSEASFRLTRISAPFMGLTVHTLSGPEELKSVLLDDASAWRKSPLIQRMLRPVLGDAILTAHDESWKRQRKAMTPGFARARILALAPVMEAAAETVARAFAAAPQPVEITAALNVAALSVIERALFTRPGPGFDRAAVRAAIETVIHNIGHVRLTDLIPMPETMPRLMGSNARRARAVLRAAVDAEIAARRAAGGGADDLTGLLMAARDTAGEGLGDESVRDNLLSLVVAGHETTAIALVWALYLVASAPDVQDRLAAEARAAIAAEADPAKRLDRLPYARQVLEETMRLYPPAPIVGRRAVRETMIAERKAAKGDIAVIAFYALHRHTRFWDDPDAFDPDRFSAERRPADPWVYRPFGGGPRACIGSAFAMTEAVLILSTLAARLEFTPSGAAPDPVMTVTLRPKDGLKLAVKPRD